MKRSALRVLAVLTALAFAVAFAASLTSAASNDAGAKPESVESTSDAAVAKLDDELKQKLEDGATASVPVFVIATDENAAAVKALLTNPHAASRNGRSIIVGRIGVQKLPKLAGYDGVRSVGSIAFKATNMPSTENPFVPRGDRHKVQNEALQAYFKREVPYGQAPPLRGSHFDELKKLNVLDAKTHKFADAWKAGYTGEGTTVSVLDGGTDWGHPDLIGTWQTWGTDAPDPGWAGWPKAFDPYDTLLFLAAPDFVDQGLSWYRPTTAATATCAQPRSRRDKPDCKVDFDAPTGPSRNFNAPVGAKEHTYTFPASFSKSGNVFLSSHPDDYLLQLYGERPAVLLTDPNVAGQYDTVYVDLDDDFQFGDEKPVTKASPVAYRDINGDGFTDLSGGLLFFIADGNTTIPGGVTDFGVDDRPAAGSMLAWTGDFDTGIEGHGTLTASNVVGQGVINGKAPTFSDLPEQRDNHGRFARDDWKKGWWFDRWHSDGDGGTYPGAVIGGAPKAKLAPMGDIYFSFEFSTQLGYFLTTSHGVDVTSNSYGSSDLDNDGFDAASQEADVWHLGTATTPLFSTGNGAPGFGTVTAPAPLAGVQVGASTQFGGTGWDSIAKISQVVDNDVIEWSNRGPGANGRAGTDVVADGSYSAGDATLNSVLDGQTAWETWGGTSRSTPVAVAATALIYQAYRQSHPGALPSAPGSEFWRQSKQYLKSSATDLGYDSFTQGSGSVDAFGAAKAAAGAAASVTPTDWRAGTYRGSKQFQVFPRVLPPGGSDSQTFTLSNPGSGSWNVSDRTLQKVATESFDFQSGSVKNEPVPNFNAPDYLMDITDRIKQHADADLVVIRASYPHAQFDGDENYESDQAWRLLAYNWTDINRDRRLWTDRDHDGIVDHSDLDTSSNIDGFNDIDFRRSEMEKGEYVRFFYHRPGSNALTGFIQHPAQRMADGIFLGFQHSTHNDAIDKTSFKVEIAYYKNVDWSWLTTTPVSGNQFTATLNVPAGTPYGMYEGAVVASSGSAKTVVPVTVAVAATSPQDAAGNITGNLTFGGPEVASQQSNQLYSNGTFFGANDWTWREESGDWRFFYYDVAKAPPPGTLFLANTTWDDAIPTDLDTLLMGRSANEYQLLGGSSPIYAPYVLDTVGKSPNAYIGSGTWRFNTASGGADDLVAGKAQEGLNAVVTHGVHFNGDRFDVPFKVTLGGANVTPSAVNLSTDSDSGTFDVTFKSSLDLAGLKAEGFGLSQPTTTVETAHQDDPDDPSSASVKRTFAVQHASQATFSTDLASNDLDLYVLYDANKDGNFTTGEIVGSSAGATGVESVRLIGPPDGSYQVWVQGFSVAGAPTFNLRSSIIQGNDLTVTGLPAGAIPAGTAVTLHVAYSKAMTAGQTYLGELLLGPPTAPRALSVPITIGRTDPLATTKASSTSVLDKQPVGAPR